MPTPSPNVNNEMAIWSVLVSTSNRRNSSSPGDHRCQSAQQEQARPYTLHEQSCDWRARHHSGGRNHDEQPRFKGAPALHKLEILCQEEERHEHREEDHADDEHSTREVLLPEELQRQHRLGRPQLHDHERCQQCHRAYEGADDLAGRPACFGALDDAVTEREQPSRGQQTARHIESALTAVARFGNEEQQPGQRQRDDGDVHQEDR